MIGSYKDLLPPPELRASTMCRPTSLDTGTNSASGASGLLPWGEEHPPPIDQGRGYPSPPPPRRAPTVKSCSASSSAIPGHRPAPAVPPQPSEVDQLGEAPTRAADAFPPPTDPHQRRWQPRAKSANGSPPKARCRAKSSRATQPKEPPAMFSNQLAAPTQTTPPGERGTLRRLGRSRVPLTSKNHPDQVGHGVAGIAGSAVLARVVVVRASRRHGAAIAAAAGASQVPPAVASTVAPSTERRGA